MCFIDVWILDFLLRFDCLEQLRLINFKREQELRAINESVFRWMIILRSRTTPCGHSSRSLVVKSDGQIQACFARWRWGEDETFRRKRMCRTWFITSYDLTVRVHTPKSKLQSHVSAQAHVDGLFWNCSKTNGRRSDGFGIFFLTLLWKLLMFPGELYTKVCAYVGRTGWRETWIMSCWGQVKSAWSLQPLGRPHLVLQSCDFWTNWTRIFVHSRPSR